MPTDPTNLHRKMDQSLDESLTEEELKALEGHLAESADANERWHRLHRLDRLLRTTPLVGPSAGFTSRVMAAIERLQLDELAERQITVGVALGLIAAALLTVPLLSAALILLVSAVSSPGTIAALLQVVTSGTGYAVDLVSDLARVLEDLATSTPMLPALLTTMIPLSMLWIWLLWYLSGRTSVKVD